MKREDYIWPEVQPKKNCPPAHAVPANGTLYRAVRNKPANELDFVRWIEEPHNVAKQLDCARHSVSLFDSVDATKTKLFGNYPNASKNGKFVAIVECVLSPKLGMMDNKGSHYNVWPQKDVSLIASMQKIVYEHLS